MRGAMTCQLFAMCFGASEPRSLAGFWSGVLGRELIDDPHDGIALLPAEEHGFRLRFLPAQEKKVGQNQMHFDLTSTSLEDQQQTVARSLELGARHIDVGQRPEEGHVVLADPDIVGDQALLRRVARDMGAELVLARVGDHGRQGHHDSLRLAAAYRDIIG